MVVFGVYGISPLASEAAITPGSPDNFITTWDTTKLKIGSTPDNQIRIQGSGSGYNYDVYWENTSSSSINGTTTSTSNNLVLTFPEPGIYRVEIAGAFPRIYSTNSRDESKILEVNQWGNIQWTSMAYAFHGAVNLRIPATDAPDLSNVTNMAYMFWSAHSLNDPINHWDISNVTSISGIFRGASAFNQSLDNWNTSNVTAMSSVFENATSFDQPLNNWDISSASDMYNFFAYIELSTANQDATLASWATQASLNSLVDNQLNIGFKSYSQIGKDAIDTLRDDLGWTITESYSASYDVSPPATLSGNPFQEKYSPEYDATTTPVTVNIPPHCTFLGWSDGIMDNPRSDVLTDNLEVTALVDCDPVSPGTFNIKQTINNEIALSIGSSLTLSPSIPGVTGGVSSGELPFNIKTNNPLGYQVDLKFSEAVPFRHLFSPSFYILNYVPQVVGVPDYNLVTPTKSHGFAYSVYSDNATQLFRHSGSTCGVGSDNTLGKCWFNRVDASVPTTIIERSGATGAEGATSSLQFRVVVDQNATPMLLEGEYQATVTVTVLPL